jgi:hypothetical protein
VFSNRWLGLAGAVLATALQIYVFVADSAFIHFYSGHAVGAMEVTEIASCG